MEQPNGQAKKLSLLIQEKTEHYDRQFDNLAASIEQLGVDLNDHTTAITNHSIALNAQTEVLKLQAEHNLLIVTSFKDIWGQAVPIKLVFYIIVLIIGGTGAISLIKF